MWNVMLDEKPQIWNGYPVNTDFRTGIQVYQILNDDEISNREKSMKACELLFPGIMPQSAEDIQKCFEWFLSGWYLDGKPRKEEKKRLYDYDVDQWRIYSAFRLQFGIDLNAADLHYWEFMGLLSTLEECAFTRVKDIRLKKLDNKMKPKEKKALYEAKEIYNLETTDAADPKEDMVKAEAVAEFNRLRG